LNGKSRGVSIKARSPPASLAFIGQVIKHSIVIWPIVKSPVSVENVIIGKLSVGLDILTISQN